MRRSSNWGSVEANISISAMNASFCMIPHLAPVDIISIIPRNPFNLTILSTTIRHLEFLTIQVNKREASALTP
uniref:Uncharacterized protein n=1 Tax=Tetranychus urticae TaxID=32264 RepID=T1JWU6_TETUR